MKMLSSDKKFSYFMHQLLLEPRESGLSTEKYQALTTQFKKESRLLFEDNQINDLLLLNDSGELLYSIAGHEDELGENLSASGFYGETILSELLQEITENKQFTVSGFGKIELFDQQVTLMGVPLFLKDSVNTKKFVGVMIALFPLNWMRETLTKYESGEIYEGLGESGDISLIQWRRGEEREAINFINTLKSDLLREPPEACQQMRTNEPDKFSMVQVLDHIDGAGWSLNPSCTPVYSVWRWLPELKWGMTLNQHKEEVLGPIEGLRQVTLLLILFYLPLFGILVRYQLRVLTRPIAGLVDAAESGTILEYPRVAVNEVNLLATALQENEKRLSKANQAKDEFLASMSHELRTPLTSIIGNSELLKDKTVDEDTRSIIEAVERAGRGQLALVNDILDISKLESGKFTIDKQPYDLSKLLNDLLLTFSPQAEDAGLLFSITQKNREERLLIGDEQRIMQILINLIGNGLKFTNQGGLQLTTWVEDNHLIYQVKDSGVGMPPAVLDKLFGRFEQADSSISRRFGGSGLGLYISQNLTMLMGGEITVSSEEGVGSLFTLRLPYQQSELPVKPLRQEKAAPVTDEPFSGHILVAEDTPELQLLERRILEGFGLTVTTANNGQEAVDLVKNNSFDAVIMDMQMPVMDGIEATKVIRASGNTIPIIALTANVMQKHRDAFDEAGCDCFLGKPINKNELLAVLKDCVNRG